jgi:hypothetical protein
VGHDRWIIAAIDVRYWPLADIVSCAAHVRLSGVKRTFLTPKPKSNWYR